MFKTMANSTHKFAFIQFCLNALKRLSLLTYAEIFAVWVFVMEVISDYPISSQPTPLTFTTKIFYCLPLDLSSPLSLIATTTNLAEGVEIPPNLAF